ncbi:MAG: gp33 family protein [Planctomycetota bacterium]|jgi:hypothetical protein
MTNELSKLVKRFNTLYFMKKAFKKKADECQSEMDKMQPMIESGMTDLEMKKMSFNNGITTSITTLIWAKVHDKDKAVSLLKKAGLDHLVLGERVNHQSLSAHLRQLETNQETIPKEWEGVIEANPTTKVVPKKL